MGNGRAIKNEGRRNSEKRLVKGKSRKEGKEKKREMNEKGQTTRQDKWNDREGS